MFTVEIQWSGRKTLDGRDRYASIFYRGRGGREDGLSYIAWEDRRVGETYSIWELIEAGARMAMRGGGNAQG